MKNKTIKKALAIGMSVLMLASTFTPVSVQAAGGWKQNKTGWWWEEDNGSYPTKSWKNIGGTWYYFDGNGYMVTGWLKLSRLVLSDGKRSNGHRLGAGRKHLVLHE